jgi:hypothetical protein
MRIYSAVQASLIGADAAEQRGLGCSNLERKVFIDQAQLIVGQTISEATPTRQSAEGLSISTFAHADGTVMTDTSLAM